MKDMKKIQCSYNLNDAGDILVRVKPSKSYVMDKMKQMKKMQDFYGDDDQEKESLLNCSFFFYYPNHNGPNAHYKDFLYFDSQYDIIKELQGASMNDRFIFFWNLGNVWSIDLET